jgi:asparagine synthase (glutamine-hydrolysing)
MCGIAGVAATDRAPADPGLLRAMTDVIAHRGPDGEGFHVDGAVGLGHRRLAIIDLATGAQPMASDDQHVWITYNGELYNYRELRRELEARGVVFRTASDTEVLLKSYEAWDLECLPRLRGMFAFGIWDGRRRRVVLARDHVGIKPLVYAWDGRRLLFGSEPKALLADRALSRELDWEALGDYLVWHYVPSPRTIYRAIRKLPPASYLTLDLDTATLVVRRYWTMRFDPDPRPSEAEWLDGLLRHLDDAVTSHLVSDVPVGAFLSGGLDSSAVVAAMARASPGRVRTFSIGFDETGFDELPHARAVAHRLGTDHYELVVKPDALEVVPRLAWQLDEPFADASAIPTYYVSKITRQHVTVALSGDGGDENFAGYRRYREALATHRRLDRWPATLVKPLLGAAARLLPPGARGQATLAYLGDDPLGRYFRLVTAHYPPPGTLLAKDARARLGGGHREVFERLARAAAAPDYVATLQALDVETYLPEDILTKVDRTSMLVSLESRVPLLDRPLMEFLATMPTAFKMRDGVGKYLLRRATQDRLPTSTLTRGKMGFGVPLGTWFRTDLADYTRDLLLGTRTRQRGLLDPVGVERLLAEHQAGPRDLSDAIWTLVCLEQWARQWQDA